MSTETSSPSIRVPATLPLNIQAAKVRMFTMFPYMDIALHSMSFLECKNVPDLNTMAVDKHWRCYYDVDAVSKWTVPQITTVIIHELWHLLRDHHSRIPGTLPPEAEAIFNKLPPEVQIPENYKSILCRLWNYATDAEINDDLVSDSLPFPVDPIFPKSLGCPDNEMAEKYYQTLKLPKDMPQQLAKALKEGKLPGLPGMPNDRSGSSSDGQTRSYEAPDGQDQRQVGKDEARNVAEITAQKIVNAQRDGSIKPGDMPAGLVRWANELLDPVIDWKRELKATLNAQSRRIKGLMDYTYARANRRQCLHGKFIFPAHCSYLPSVAISVDTSGSMSDTDIAQGLAEVREALKCLEGFEMSFISCDTAATVTKRVFSLKDLSVVGGGGTDMGVALHAMAELKPDVAVLVTDGYTSYPEKNPFTPKTHFITLLVQNGAYPSYGKVIHGYDRKKSQT